MGESRAAYRYARAILETAEEHNALDRVSKDFETVENLTRESHDFLLFLRSPVINKEKKKRILADLLKNNVSDISYNFILLLISKSRENILPEIIQQFYQLRDERLGIENATVRAATPFTKEQEKQLLEHLRHLTKKQVRLHYVIDKGLTGGFAVQIGDTVWDGSIAHQLEILRERFIEGAHIGS